MLRVLVRVTVSLAVPQGDRVPRGVLERVGDFDLALVFDQLEGFEIVGCAVGFGRGGEVEGGFHDGIHPLGHPDKLESLHRRGSDHQPQRVRQPDVLARQNHQAAQDEPRVFPGVKHLRQPVEGGIRVGAAHGLDEGADRVVVGVAVLVVEHRPPLDGFLRHLQGDLDHAVFVGRGGFDGQFQGVERVAGISSGDADQVLHGFGGEVHLAGPVAPFGVRKGTRQQGLDVLILEGTQLKDPRAAHQGADHLKVGVFRGRADQREGAVLHMGEQGVLLGFVPAVDFIHEQEGAFAVHLAPLDGLPDDLAQAGFAVQHGGEGLEMRLGLVGDDGGEGGFARARRPPQDDGGEQAVGFNGAAQEFARPDDVLLPDELVQGAGAHPGGERGFGLHFFLHGVGEQVHVGIVSRAGWPAGRRVNSPADLPSRAVNEIL